MKRALLQFSGTAILLAGALVLGTAETAWTQAPTSLSYPGTNVFIANVSNVYLAPNLAGNAASYTIAPALPVGLSFNTNTGVISGAPTAASAATTYTITAIGTNPAQTTSATTSIQITNNYFNNNYAVVSFTNASVINGTTGAAITNLTAPSTGTAAGDVVVYRGVATLSGQAIDCIVKTVSVTSGTTFTAYDQEAASGSNYSSNDAKFFSPQVSFPSGGGNIQYSFQFILGGSYQTGSQSGSNVILQNVKINTYDIDGNTQANSNQSNEFGGFSTSEVGSATTLEPAVYNAATGLTTYRSSSIANSAVVTADPTRVRVTYNNISDFSVRVGGAGTAYFFVDFSAGPAFSTAVETDVPSVDLNTNQIGVNNFGTGCGTNMNFTASSQTNITPTTGSNLTRLQVSFPTAEILNTTNEHLIVNGATSGGTLALSSDIAATTVALGGVTYNVASTTASGVRTIVFDKTNFTIAQAEALLDALQYNNNATAPISGSRNFTVNIRNSAFQSPNAIMTATLNCVSISGNIFHDVNAMVDNTVNATGTAGQFTANSLYAVRVNPANNQVIDAKPIAAGGAYSFGTVTPGTYNIYVSTTNPAAGTTFTAATFPANYIATGENLGAGAGTDGLTDGKLTVTIGSQNITNANFGLQIPPTTSNSTINNIANPGGFNGYVIPNGTFGTNDVDGVIDSILITGFPTGANYIKIGTIVYTNGGNCPPQSSCIAWPAGGVVVPFASGNPVPAISVDPSAEGNTSVAINFSAWDNGRSQSNTSTVTLNFIGTSYYGLSGNVWNDANANGQRGGTEGLVAPADAGQTLYALLEQQNNTYSGQPTILAYTAINATTGYSFNNVPGGNDYTVRIVARTTAPVTGAAASTVNANLADKWIGVSTNANGTVVANQNTTNLSIAIPALNSNKTNQNFGIEQMPDATDVNTSIPAPSVGTLLTLNASNPSLPVPPAVDQEDGTLALGSTFIATTLPQFTTLRYNGQPVVLGQRYTNFNPAQLQIQITSSTVGKTGTSFQFNYLDAAGIADPTPATYAITWNTPLPVLMGAFNVTKTAETVNLTWITYSETENRGFSVERSDNGSSWNTLGFVASAAQDGNSNAKLSYSFDDQKPANGVNYYRLKQTDYNGNYAYSEVKKISFTTDNTISIYPNPAADYVYVTVADWTKVAAVTILDVQGRVVMNSNNASQGISLSGLAKGSYILQVKQSNGQVSSFKFIKS